MKIHALRTGNVALQSADGPNAGPDWLVLERAPDWDQWLPIYSWVIEHPEGLIVIDCGETMRAFEPGYFDRDLFTRFIYERMFHFSLQPEDEIGPRMREIGLAPEEVRWVILTHLHADHVDGMTYFPQAEFLVAKQEHEEALLRPTGALPNRWPSWFAPRLIEYVEKPIGPFPRSYTITQAGDLHLVPTPGHTRGHQSVLLELDDLTIFFAGDTSFSEEQMLIASTIGFNLDTRATKATLETIRTLASERPTIYLPSHDPKSKARLLERRITSIS